MYTCIYTSYFLSSCIYLHCNNYKLLFPEAALFLLACTIPSVVRACVLLHTQWCENRQSCRTLSNKSSECETELCTKYLGSMIRVVKISQNVHQLAQYTPRSLIELALLHMQHVCHTRLCILTAV